MALHVIQVKTPRGIALPQNKHVFDHRGGTLGRADNNTWVLPDPDRFLSSCHCEIICINSVFYLEDKSTNGTFVNDALEPVGRGVRHQLRDGDFFEIGDFRFAVQLVSPAVGVPVSPFDITSPFDAPVAPFQSQPSADFFGQEMGDVSNLFEQQEQDPLALWDKKPQAVSSPLGAAPFFAASSDENALLDSFVGLGQAAQNNDFQSMDASAGMDQSVSWPSAGTENQIPEDWADGLLKQSSVKDKDAFFDDLLAPLPAVATPLVAAKSVLDKDPDIIFEKPDPTKEASLAELIFNSSVPPENTKPLFASGAEQGFNMPPLDIASATSDVSSPHAASIAPVTAVKPQAQNPQTAQAHSNSTNNILIDALGLDRSRLSETDITEISRLSGLLIREIVDGMLGVLRSRANIKNEFRMNVTTIQSVENNPLKFSVNVDDALECLFIKKSNAYKKPVDAFREGFQEIAEHQLAMIAGIRQGFDAMMERFDPVQLEKNFNRQAKSSVIPGMQKAKNWNGYTDYYQSLTGNMERSFQHLFGSEFVSAYEDQLRRLMAARQRGKLNDDV